MDDENKQERLPRSSQLTQWVTGLIILVLFSGMMLFGVDVRVFDKILLWIFGGLAVLFILRFFFSIFLDLSALLNFILTVIGRRG